MDGLVNQYNYLGLRKNKVKFKIKNIYNLLLIIFLEFFLYGICFIYGFDALFVFLLTYVLLIISYPPRYLAEPLATLYAYYTFWYIIPFLLAPRFKNFDFSEGPPIISLCMTSITMTIGVIVLSRHNQHYQAMRKAFSIKNLSNLVPWIILFFMLMVFSTFGLVLNTGGLLSWIENPGQAFLTREGAGIYTLTLKFSSLLFSFSFGVYVFLNKKKWFLLIIPVIITLIFSPFLNSKSQIFTSIFFIFLLYIVNIKIKISTIFFLLSLLAASFILGVFFRSSSWITLDQFFEYSLDYFNAFDLLIVLVKDFDPGFMETFFLPFNKFLTPFGAKEDVFYDLSSWLTSIYFPRSWDIRATQQWPIEADLYLSFYYFLSIPVVYIFFYIIKIPYLRACKKYNTSNTDSIGWIFISVYLNIYMISHLRGSLILWTDFYLIPFLLFEFLFFKKIIFGKNK